MLETPNVSTNDAVEAEPLYYIAAMGADYSNTWCNEAFGPATLDECKKHMARAQQQFAELNAKALDIVMQYGIEWCDRIKAHLDNNDLQPLQLFNADVFDSSTHMQWLRQGMQDVINEKDGIDYKILRLKSILKDPEHTVIAHDSYHGNLYVTDFFNDTDDSLRTSAFASFITTLTPNQLTGIRDNDKLPAYAAHITLIITDTEIREARKDIMAICPQSWAYASHKNPSQFDDLANFTPTDDIYHIHPQADVDNFEWTPSW